MEELQTKLLKSKSRELVRFIKIHDELVQFHFHLLKHEQNSNWLNDREVAAFKSAVKWKNQQMAKSLVRLQELRMNLVICLRFDTLKKPITGFSAN